MRPAKSLLSSIAAVILLSGCGYTLVRNDATPVCITGFSNQTLQPRIEQAVADGLRTAILGSPGFRLVSSRQGAQLLVSGTVVRFEREPLFFAPGSPASVVVARFFLEVEVVLRGREEVRRTVSETIAVPLAVTYAEEEMLREIGNRAGARILAVMRDTHDRQR